MKESNGTGKHGYYPVLDGLRGISILWVIAAHIPPDISIGPLVNFFKSRGTLGVELFFAVSGLMVTRSLEQCAREASAPGPRAVVVPFLVKRISRTWPAYFLLLALVALIAVFQPAMRMKLEGIRDILWGYPLFLSNYLWVNFPAEPPSSLVITWSLAFEEQFYLLMAGCAFFFPKRFRHFLWAGCVASIVLRSLPILEIGTYSYNGLRSMPHLRFDAVGWACLAWLHRDSIEAFFCRSWRWLPSLLFILFAFVVWSFRKDWGLPWAIHVYTILSPVFLGVVLTLMFFREENWIKKSLSWRPLAWVGLVSYEVYLFHQLTINVFSQAKLNSLAAFFIFVPLASFGIAWFVFRYFSKPLQKWIRARFRTTIYEGRES